MTAASDYSGSNPHRDSPDSEELRMTAQIIQFSDYQNPDDLAPMHGDIEKRPAKRSHTAADVFNALTIATAVEEYNAPEKTCVISEDKFYRAGSLENLAVKLGVWNIAEQTGWKTQERERWQPKSLWIAPAIPGTILTRWIPRHS